ncbi:M20 family metallo-hydrolase [Neobacillus mesonae]|uniref:M20 family metallo-hydrolase n=1 Tax=Neobacillus mesonae TaxID=1193713 RepID=UPI00203D9A5C|nr:M20 family metallo-hydrolase [Neobacillus mesonae]MCM3569291.1 M20 family metallo-hydrolase [Neobacillus mesonae]
MKQLYKINSERLLQRVEELSKIGKTPENGVTRKALTKDDYEAQQLVANWMREAGLEVRVDNLGNLIGRKEGNDSNAPSIMIGSHIDTVPNGGKYDGTIGVLGGIEVAQFIHDEGMQTKYPIEVIAFCDEEGTRFQGGLFGSRGMVGKVTELELLKKDDNGISRYEALKSFGLNPDLIHESVRCKGEIKVFLELHIEQGPYLQSIDKPVGIVTGIAGPAWFSVKIFGESGHAGTVPMNLRRDPIAGAAKIIGFIEEVCSKDSNSQTVGTVGKITAIPGGSNVIPELVEFTLDIRDIDLERRNQTISKIKNEIARICKDRELRYEIVEHLIKDPTMCAPHVVEKMMEIGKSLELDAPKMISGAGHDAMAIGEIADIGVIFVRCLNGISHNPKESAAIMDITKGVSLLQETVLNYVK